LINKYLDVSEDCMLASPKLIDMLPAPPDTTSVPVSNITTLTKVRRRVAQEDRGHFLNTLRGSFNMVRLHPPRVANLKT
jgi:hypothetical protein